MNKKFISALCICFLALTAIAGSSYYVKEGADKGKVNLKNSTENATTVNSKEAKNDIEEKTDKSKETQTKKDETNGSKTNLQNNKTLADAKKDTITKDNVVKEDNGDEVIENENKKNEKKNNDKKNNSRKDNTAGNKSNKVVKENPIKGDGSLKGLSTEANAAINKLSFNRDSELTWPLNGNILLEYSMDSTVYFSTLNEYKTNPAIIIQAEEFAPVIAAAKGVVTELGENDEIGVYMKMAIGNDYELTYGQIVNPTVKVGETVKAGQSIACVNEPTRYYEKEGYNLYFSVTKDGKPVDPMEFLVLSE